MELLKRRADVRTEVIYRRMKAFTALTPAEGALLRAAGEATATTWQRGSPMDGAGEAGAAPRYILSGWAAYMRQLDDGRRQLIRLLLPGDAAAGVAPGQRMAIICIAPVTTVDGESIGAAACDPDRYPGIAAAVTMAHAQERAELMDQAVRLGRQTAYERTASQFMELHRRCNAIDQAQGGDMEFPLTQEMLGDLLGLSVVHVNRTVQLMRREELIRMASNRLRLLDLPKLARIAGI